MGLTYDELNTLSCLRKNQLMGPVSTFRSLLATWRDLEPEIVGKKVKHFFTCYAINRHKTLTLTPAFYNNSNSINPYRNDQRQFIYNEQWTF